MGDSREHAPDKILVPLGGGRGNWRSKLVFRRKRGQAHRYHDGLLEYTAALATTSAAPTAAASKPYFSAADKDPKINWEWMLVIGVFAGAFASSKLSGDRPAVVVPRLWAERFGSRPSRRFIGAFLGGALLMMGARLAGGCTSGHGISGALQLAVSSWVFLITIFLSGVAAATALYGWRGGRNV